MVEVIVGLIQIMPERELLTEVLLLVPFSLSDKLVVILHLIYGKLSWLACLW